MRLDSRAYRIILHSYRLLYRRMQVANYVMQSGIRPIQEGLARAGAMVRKVKHEVKAVRATRVQKPWTVQPLELRVLLSITPQLSGNTVTFNQDSGTSDNLYLRSNSGQLQYSTDDSTWFTDLDPSTPGTQNVALNGVITINSHAAGDTYIESLNAPGSVFTLNSDVSVIIDNNQILSSRVIGSGTNQATDPSTGNSGTISINAPQITVSTGASILSFADSGKTAGSITLAALDNTVHNDPLLPNENDTNAGVTISGTVHGGDVSITSDADSIYTFQDGSTASNIIVNQLNQIALLAGVSISNATSGITVNSGANIQSANLTIHSEAHTSAKVQALSLSTSIAVAVGKSDPSATINIASGSTINATGNADITTDTHGILHIGAKQNVIPSAGSAVNVTLAVGLMTMTSTVDAEGSLTVGGNLNLHSTSTKDLSVTSAAASYNNGMAGVGLAYSSADVTTEATLGGTATATGNVEVRSDAGIALNVTAGTSQVGNGLAATLTFGIQGAAGDAGSKLQNWWSGKKPATNAKSGGSVPVALSGAIAVSDQTNTVSAEIAASANVTSTTGRIDVLAVSTDQPQIATIAAVDSAAFDETSSDPGFNKDNSIAVAVNVGNFTNSVTAEIGNGATVSAANAVNVNAQAILPQLNNWDQIHGIDDITNKLNTNLGVQNGFFNSWAQASATGDTTTFAGSVNVVTFNNSATSTIDSNAQVTQDRGTGAASFAVNPSSAVSNDVITTNSTGDNKLSTGDQIVYTDGGGTAIGGLVNGQTYYVIRESATQIELADSLDDALNGNAITLNGAAATGTNHKITVKQGVFVKANAESETVNLSGVASIGQLKDILSTVFSKIDANQTASFGGVGGAYNGVTQNTNATANIKSGANVTGFAVHVTADTGNRDIGIGESGGKGGKFAIFGSYSELDSTDNVLAQIENGATVNAKGTTSVDPTNTTSSLWVHANDDAQLYTFAGGIAVGTNVGIGVAIGINNVTRNVSAVIGDTGTTDSTPSGSVTSSGAIDVDSSGTGQIISASLAGAYTSDEPEAEQTDEEQETPEDQSGNQAMFGISISGDVALNNLTTTTVAQIHDANVTGSSTSLSVTATDSSDILAVAGSVAISTSETSSTGIAGSYTQNTDDVTTSATIQHSSLSSTGALTVSATGDEDILSISASGSDASNGLSVAGQVSYNTITSDVEAGIEDSSGVTGASSVSVTAMDDASIMAISGAIAYGGKAGIGASVVLNKVDSDTDAEISDSDVTDTGALTVSATGERTILAVAAAIGASAGQMAAAGSVAINQVDQNTGDGVFATVSGKLLNGVSAGGNISVAASNTVDHSNAPSFLVDNRDPTILAVTGDIAAAPSGTAGIGFSYSENDVGTKVKATVLNTSLTTSNGTVQVTANGADVIQAVAAGGSGAENTAIAGSVTLNSISDTIETDVTDSTITGTSDVTLGATSGGTIESIAGSISIGGNVSAGAAAATNTITDSAIVDVSGGNVTSSNGMMKVKGLSDALIKSLAATGAFSGQLSIAGSVTLNTIRDTTQAIVENGATVTGSGDTTVSANDTSEEDSLAGQLTISVGAGAAGAAVTTNDIGNTIQAYVDGATVKSTGGAVSITAGQDSTISTIAAGGSGAEFFAGGGSIALNKLRNTIDAHVSDGGSAQGQTGATVQATDTSTLQAFGGNLSISVAGAAVGAAVTTNDIADTIEAYVDSSTLKTTTGTVTISATATDEIDTEAASGSVSAGFSGDASVTLNKIRNTIQAYVAGTTSQSTVSGPGGVTLTASDTSTLNSFAGALSVAVVGAAVGASVATNDIASTIEAYIDNGSVSSSSGLTKLQSTEGGTITSITAGGVDGDLIAGGGSVSLNKMANTLDTHITGSSQVTGANGVQLLATDNPTIHSLAGTVAGADLGGAVGAALATNDIGDTVKARIEGSTVSSSGGAVALNATSSGEIKTLSAGISGAGTAAIGGSVSLNKIHKTLDAHISGSSTVTGQTDVTVNAADTSTIESLSGQIGGAGVAAIGASASYNDIANTISAYSDTSSVTATTGSINITANQGGTIETTSAGGNASGIVSLGGSIVINMTASNVQAYINGGTVTANNNIVIEATQTSSVTAEGGTINASLADGYGATVVVNTMSNTTNAYAAGANVTAKGVGTGASVPLWNATTGTQGTEVVKGLSIIASSNDSLTNYVFSATIAGSAVGLNVLTNVVGDTTNAYIDNSQIGSTTNNGGSVRVRAHQETDENDYSGALSGGGVGVGADVDTTLMKNTTKAYITDSDQVNRTTVNAADVEVSALTRENPTIYVGGVGAGLSTGVAGSSAAVVSQGTTEAYISEANVNSNGGLRVLANDAATVHDNAGALAIGLDVGGGGSIGVVSIGNTTKAHMDGVTTNAKGATQVQADSNSTINVATGTGAGGGIAGIAGAIIVAPITNVTQAYIQAGTRNSNVNQDSTYKTSSQTLTVQANDNASITSNAGSLAVALVASGGAAVAVPTIKDRSEAWIGSNTMASAQGNVTVQATSNRSITSNTVANAGAAGASINGAYDLAGIGTGIATDGAGFIGSLASTISNAISRSAGAPELPSDSEAQKAKTNSTTTAFSPTSGLSTASTTTNTTKAWIGSSATVHSDADLLVKALAIISSNVSAGGVTVGLLAGVGGSTAEANISADTEAYIDSGAHATAGGQVQAIADGTQIGSTVNATAGSGGIVGLGASVARSWINSTVDAFANDSTAAAPTTLSAGTDINIQALSHTTTNVTSNADVGGVVSGADTKGDGFVNNIVHAYAGNNSSLTSGTDTTIDAESNNGITTNVTGGSGGLVGSGAAEATSQVNSYDTQAYTGTGANITAAGNFNLTAYNTEDLNATASQTVVSGIADNNTSAIARTVTGLTKVEVGANSTITANVIFIYGDDVALTYNANATASVPFDLAGTNTAATNADATSNTYANIDSGVTLTGNSSVTIKADITSGQFISVASTSTTGLTGTLTSTATSNKSTFATVNGNSAATITTRNLTVESSVPYLETDHYTQSATTNAHTVTHLVTEVVGTVCNVVGTVVCGWGLFCDPTEVCTDITKTVAEVLGASVTATTPGSENMLNTINFNSTVNIQGADDPVLDVDSTGKITTMTGVTATDQFGNPLTVGETVTGDRIVVNPILNQTVGGVLISASNGATNGNAVINFDPAFNNVTINNASTKKLYVGNIEVFNTTTPPTINTSAREGLDNWTYTLNTNANTTLVDIENTNSTPTDMTLQGHILNPGGTTKLYNKAGNIIDASSSDNITTRLVDIKADGGSAGQDGSPIFVLLPINNGTQYPSGITEVVGDQGVNLDLSSAMEENITNNQFTVNNISSAHGNVVINVNDGIHFESAQVTRLTLTDNSQITGIALECDWDPATAVNNAADSISVGYPHSLTTGDEVTYFNGGGTSVGGLTSGRAYNVITVDDQTVQLGEEFGASNVSTANDTISFANDIDLQNGDALVYSGNGNGITGLTDGQTYYVRMVDSKTIKLADSLADELAGNFIDFTSTGGAGQTLHFALDNSVATGDDHRLYADAYYIQVGDTVTKVDNSDITNVETGVVTTQVATDTQITLQNITANVGDVTITAGTTTLAHSNVILDGSITAGGTASIDAISGDITSTGSGQLITGQNIVINASNGAIGTSALNVRTNVGTGHINAAAGNDVYMTETTGDMRVGLITSSNGQVDLTAAAGSIVDADNDAASDVNADTIILSATGSIGSVGNALEIDPVNLTATAGGDIVITCTTGDLVVQNVTTTGGNVILTTANGELELRTISAVAGNVTLNSSEDITDLKNTGAADIIANSITMTATGSIGTSSNDIDINSSSTGSLTADAGGGIYVTEDTGSLTVNHAIAGTGDVRLTVPDTTGSGDDLIVLANGEVSSVSGDVTLHVGDNITINSGALIASGATTGTTINIDGDFGNNDLAGTIITILGILSGQTISILGGTQADTFNLDDVNEVANGTTTVLGGNGNDTFNVTPNAANPPTLNGDNTELVIDGQNGSDNYNITIWGAGNSHIVAIDHGTGSSDVNTMVVNGTDNADSFLLRKNFLAAIHGDTAERIDYDTSMNGGMTINALGGDDYFAADDNSTPTHFYGGDGNDTVQIGQMFNSPRDEPQVAGGDEAATILTTKGYLTNGVSYPLDAHGGAGDDTFVMFHNTAPVSLYGDDGNDTFVVRAFILVSTGQADANQQVTDVNSGTGNNNINYALNAPVKIDGGSGTDKVVIVGTDANDTIVVTNQGVYGMGLFVSYTNIEDLQIETGAGDDTIYVLSTMPGVKTDIYGGTGNDHFFIGQAPPPSVWNTPLAYVGTAGIQGPLYIHGGESDNPNTTIPAPLMLPTETNPIQFTPEVTPPVDESLSVDTMVVDNTASTTNDSGTLTNNQIEGLNMGPDTTIDGTAFNGGITYDNLEIIDVDLGSGNDMLNVESVASNAITVLRGNAGDDTFDITAPAAPNSMLVAYGDNAASTSFRGAPGNDTIDASASSEPAVLYGGAGNDTVLGGSGNDFIAGGSGNDTLGGGDGNDVIFGDAGFDVNLYTRVITVVTSGQPGADNFNAPGNDTITDGNGNDVIFGDQGAITQVGGTQNVLTVGGTMQTAETVNETLGGTDTITTGNGNKTIFGGAGGDQITTGNGNQVIVGDDGTASFAPDGTLLSISTRNDTVGGADTIQAGAGQQVIFGGLGGDTITTSPDASRRVIVGDQGSATFSPLGVLLSITTGTPGVGGADTISTGSGNNVIFGGTGADIITTQGGNNIIVGDDGNATFSAAGALLNITTSDVTDGGDDQITSGSGNDVIFGGSGNDTINAGDGNNIVLGDNGNATFDGNGNVLTVMSSDFTTGGNDNITTGAGNDMIIGGVGSDFIDAGDGNDVILGDNGDLYFNLDNDPTTLDEAATVDPSVGGNDIINGDGGNDFIAGGAGADTIDGGAGNDVILGDNGQFTFINGQIADVAITDPLFGAGDTITGDAGNDVIIGGTGADTISGGDGNDVILGDNGELTFNNGILATATSNNPTIGGNDTITGDAGDDVIIGGTGSDTISGGDGNDMIAGDDAMYDCTNPANATFATIFMNASQGGAADNISGGAGNDLILGGNGGDTIDGGDGNDLIFGDFATINGNIDLSQLPLAEAVHPFTFTSTDTTVAADGGNDYITGDAGDDILIGGQGSDTIYGGDGNDDIIGGSNVPGAADSGDNLDGGAGDDVIAGDNASILRTGTTLSTLDRALSGTVIYDANGNPMVTSASQVNPLGSPERQITLFDQSTNPVPGTWGDDNIAGGAGNDMLFGEMGNDTIQGDSTISPVSATPTYLPGDLNHDGKVDLTDLTILASHWQQSGTAAEGDLNGDGIINLTDLTILASEWQTTAASSGPPAIVVPTTTSIEDYAGVGTDGNDYIEGGAGNDTIFGDLGQDDIIGGSSDLFGYSTPSQRPDGSDTIYGGAGTRVAINDPGDTSPNGHARDADVILGDNGDIFNLTGTNGVGTGSFLTFNYDAFNSMKVIPRAVKLVDYTWGGSPSDIGAADLIQGEAGDDTIYGEVGNDVLFGNGQDDNIIGGSGNDRIYGGTGDDGILGDDGIIFTSRNGFTEPLNGVNVPNVQTTLTVDNNTGAVVYITGELLKTAQLLAPTQGGNDLIYGGLGNDFIHGGAGDDAISGAEALPAFYNTLPVGAAFYAPFSTNIDPNNPLGYNSATRTFAWFNHNNPRQEIPNFFLNFAAYTSAANPDGTKIDDGNDSIFGDDGNDWIVGGTDNNHLFGGNGDDVLNADNNLDTAGGLNNVADDSTFADGDFVYGGNGLDTMIANSTSDRLFDWFNGFDYYIYPFDADGAPYVYNNFSPTNQAFLLALGQAGGADQTLTEPNGELGLFTDQSPLANANKGNTHNDELDDIDANKPTSQGAPENDAPVHTQAQTQAYALGTTIPDSSVLVWTDYSDTTKQSVYIYGTAGNDVIDVSKGTPPNTINVTLNGTLIATLPTTLYHYYIYGRGGNDSITVEPTVDNHPVFFLYGQDGNDTLKAGAGNTYLDGGNGNDTLIGGNARDMLVGGAGSDTLTGGDNDDILISGIFVYSEVLDATSAIFNEWIRNDLNATQRRADLKAGTGYTLGFRIDNTTVLDDHTLNVLNGANGNNWLLYNVLDQVTIGSHDLLN